MIHAICRLIRSRFHLATRGGARGKIWMTLAVLAGSMLIQQKAFANHESGSFCIFQRENSSFQVVDVYPTTDRSEQWACYEAEKQCRYDLRRDQQCSRYSSGDYGWIEEEERILCESRDSHNRTCELRGEAQNSGRLVDQRSQSKCIQGTDWGVDEGRNTMWVRDGCRGVFAVEVEYYKEPGVPPQIEAPDHDRDHFR